ncbi:Uncharacterized protein dnm_022570 [Desulfonema magnum]|uniref:Uncharacterized protein n=1 Tax=Desulfonema magnum TaxID=45655 RepID=A0A975BIS4_9BACT|nr:Uncharacterized protein dnm_022570 [Desulfonema magnum]
MLYVLCLKKSRSRQLLLYATTAALMSQQKNGILIIFPNT